MTRSTKLTTGLALRRQWVSASKRMTMLGAWSSRLKARARACQVATTTSNLPAWVSSRLQAHLRHCLYSICDREIRGKSVEDVLSPNLRGLGIPSFPAAISPLNARWEGNSARPVAFVVACETMICLQRLNFYAWVGLNWEGRRVTREFT